MSSDLSQETLYGIDQFAKLTGYISVEGLQSYDEQGLLKPAAVDPATGQRLYTHEQYQHALRLVELDYHQVPPDKLHEFMRDPSPEHQGKVFDWKIRELQANGDSEDSNNLRSLRNKRAFPWRGEAYEVTVEDRPAVPFVFRSSPVDHNAIEKTREQAFKDVGAAIEEHNLMPASPPISLYLTVAGVTSVASGFEVPESISMDGGLQVGSIPGGRWYSVRHTGPYDHLGHIPLILRDRVEQDGITVHQLHGEFTTREVFVVGPWDTSDVSQWVTDTCWLTGPAELT